MSGHLSDKDLERYRRREMAPGELLAADDHLSSCDSCYGRFGGALPSKVYALPRRLIDAGALNVGHLTYAELEAYVEGSLSIQDRERKRIHLDACSQCEIDVADLALIRSSLDGDRVFTPRRSTGSVGRIAMLWQSRSFRTSAQIAGVALLAFLVIWFATIPMRSELNAAKALIQKQGGAIESLEGKLAAMSEQNAVLQRELQESQAGLAAMESRLRATPESRAEPGLRRVPWLPLSLIDGRDTVALDSKGRLSGITSLSPAEERLIKRTLATGHPSTPNVLAKLAGPPPLSMGSDAGSEPYSLLAPVAQVVETGTPTFRWRPVTGAVSYVVGIYRSDLDEVASSEPLTVTEWTITHPLKQGVIYSWQVKAFKGGDTIKLPRAGERDAKFTVLEPQKANQLKRAREKYSGSHLVLGVLYADAGLLDDAEREFEQLARANPASPIADQLLRYVRSLRPK